VLRPATPWPDVLFGKVNPGGKLPVSFPRVLGQVPIYYNHEPTGRPCDVTFECNSRYRDLAACDPLYAFGFGLSYTKFSATNLRLSTHNVSKNGKVTASVDVANTGARIGDDVLQVYIHDPVASISQPVRRLRGFQRITLGPGAKQTVNFTLDNTDFGFYDNRSKFVVEPGSIDVYAGDRSSADLTQSFTVRGSISARPLSANRAGVVDARPHGSPETVTSTAAARRRPSAAAVRSPRYAARILRSWCSVACRVSIGRPSPG
jgi:hypothetical protein